MLSDQDDENYLILHINYMKLHKKYFVPFLGGFEVRLDGGNTVKPTKAEWGREGLSVVQNRVNSRGRNCAEIISFFKKQCSTETFFFLRS